MSALPPNTPAPVLAAVTALVHNGYVFDRLVWHPSSTQPLARMVLTGPTWILVLIGIRWLIAYGLFRFPVTSSIGTSLIRYGFAQQPVHYIDADGVTH